MEQFINHFFKVGGNLFINRDLAKSLAEICLPVFFAPSFPKEKMNWESVYEYAPIIFITKRDEVDIAVYNCLIENGYKEAWFLSMFNKKEREALGRLMG